MITLRLSRHCHLGIINVALYNAHAYPKSICETHVNITRTGFKIIIKPCSL